MRRIGFIGVLMLAAAAWAITSFAGASDTHTYKIQMYNAFGIVNGSDVRIGGVNAGSVTDLGIDQDKRAVVTVSLSGPLSVIGKDTTCASQPQSLIAEYFIDCSPKGPPASDGYEIPASHVQQTVQLDQVADSFRQSYRDRFSELINEFGTALAGNAHDLNQAIRLGSPSLTQLRKVLHILAQQNQTIRDLNVNSDRIFSELAANRQNVVRFIQEARDTAAASAARRDDLAVDFNRLDNFLHELGPTSQQLAATARASTPMLADLRAAAPGLNTLAVNLPAFDTASKTSLVTLGRAAVVGKKALRQGQDDIQALSAAAKNSRPVADTLAKFLLDVATPKRAVDVDNRAAKTCNNKTRPCYSTGRKAPTGYTGLEGLLNYVYYQAGAINSFDEVGHLLHFTLYDVNTGPCGNFSTGHDATTGEPGVPTKSGTGTTTDITKTAPCVSWLGPNQPGISQQLNLPPYDKSVCSKGLVTDNAANRAICDPNGKTKTTKTTAPKRTPVKHTAHHGPQGPTGPTGPTGVTGPTGTTGPIPNLPTPGGLPNAGGTIQHLRDLLGLGGNGGGVGGGLRHGLNNLGSGSGSPKPNGRAATDLLNFLLSN
jgi:phospholipid/cholesterol/gamma-HCH transport system substrate-binding protein